MSLTKSQKKYIKENVSRLSLSDLARDLTLPEKQIKEYLKRIWRDEKYKKRVVKDTKPSPNYFESILTIDSKTWIKNNWKFLILLALLVFVSYFNSLGNVFLSDDLASIKNNFEINKTSYFWPSVFFLRPLTIFIINKFFGLNPAFYRLANILFHLGSVCVIYAIVSLFLKSPLAFFAAGIFAVHPVLSESVTWISGGNYAQYSFLILLSFLFYLLSTNNKRLYFVSILFFMLSLLSEPRAVVFIGILVAWEFASGNLAKNWRKLIPFCVPIAIVLALSLLKVGERFASIQTEFGRKEILVNPFVNAPIAIGNYFKALFFPKDLTFYYSETTFSKIGLLLRRLSFISYLGLIIYSYIRRQRFVFFWLLFFIITLLPTLTPLNVASWMAERYIYLGSLGIFVAVILAFKNFSEIKNMKTATYIILSLIIIILSARTIARNIDWKSEENLWQATLKVSPNSVNAIHNLGNVYIRKGDMEQGAFLCKKAIAMRPDYADPYNNLAFIYHKTERFEQAIENYQKAISLNPYLWNAHKGLAEVYFDQKNYILAKEHMVQAIKIRPEVPIFHTDLGLIYLKLGEKEKATKEFEKALEIAPNEQNAKRMLQFMRIGMNVDIDGGLY